jgi:hypothetical protein
MSTERSSTSSSLKARCPKTGEGFDYLYGAGIILMILAFIVLLGYFTG